MALEKLKLKLTGVAPLLMHNGHLADRTNRFARQIKDITSRKKKTDEDYLELRKVEWLGGLYLNEKNEVGVTSDVIFGLGYAGAKKNKNGTTFKAAVVESAPFFKLDYDGPTDLDELYEDGRFVDYRNVGIRGSSVMRARPVFRPRWELLFGLEVETDIIDMKDVIQAYEQAGRLCGIGDYGPRYGRFEITRMR